MKTCRKCNTNLTYSKFSKDNSKPDGLCTVCKSCKSIYRKSYYRKNKDRAIQQTNEWCRKNKDKVKQYYSNRMNKRRDEINEKRRLKHKRRYANDPAYKMAHICRSWLKRTLLAAGKEKDFVTFDKIGYTREDLVKRIEMQFSGGMSWDNYGDWEIDHKIPMSAMIRRGITDPGRINMLSNLQPLWKKQNRSKGARYTG